VHDYAAPAEASRVIYIDGELVATRDEITFAKWTAQNILEGRTGK